MRLIDADLLIKHLEEVQKTANEFGNSERFDDIAGCIALVKAEKTIIDCGEIDHDVFGKIPYMDFRPRMTEDKLNEITSRVCDIFRHTEFYDCTFCDKGMGGDCIECEEEHTVYFLLDVIASLHNELYKQVKGKYYDYMFHWANLGYGGSPDDSMFKDQKGSEPNEAN